MLDLVIDTDLGVDDAAAIAWLLCQPRYPVRVLGFGTVAGNTTLDNATNNLLVLLEALGRSDLPVTMGAERPSVQPLSRAGAAIHGPDGFWGLGAANPHDLSALPRDVPAFYRDLAEAHPGAGLLTLGPLTNVAQALQRYPDAMRRFDRLVVLGGAWRGGNITAVAEFNIWQDPQAAEQVLRSGLPISLVSLDAFEQMRFGPAELERLRQSGSPAARLLAPALAGYLQVQMAAGLPDASIPDLAAAMLALDPALGSGRPGLVRVVTDSALALGQTIIAFEFQQRVGLLVPPAEMGAIMQQWLTDPGFDLMGAFASRVAAAPDNAQVITAVAGSEMLARFMETLVTA